MTTIPLSLLPVQSRLCDHPLHTLTMTVTVAPGVLGPSGFITANTSRRQVMLYSELLSVIEKEHRLTSTERRVMWGSRV